MDRNIRQSNEQRMRTNYECGVRKALVERNIFDYKSFGNCSVEWIRMVTFETSVDDPYHLPNGSNAHVAKKRNHP